MEPYYLVIVICLIALAISDLIVGVSNDAVNFLNAAIGSRVAKRRVIFTVATAGILLGALSSNGMMEIARKGIFHPEMFSFADIMTVFLAVMITDILLLDTFNTLGMPTSTTVSVVFELLGAAFTVACLKIVATGAHFSSLGDYLNGENALLIIAGIFLSVFIAFTVGAIVQYISRLLFSFNLNATLKKYGPFFGGIAVTTIAYFMLIKGMKGSNLLPETASNWMANNTLLLILGTLVFCTAVCFLLLRAFKVNVLKFVVLSGTFSLAMAFAGNDLVNFIGLPIAGWQSYALFSASSVPADELGMSALGEKLHTSTPVLLAAGAIMAITLWLSKKARSVTETEVNLASESAGREQFKSNAVARWMVRGGIAVGKAGRQLLPSTLVDKVDARFERSAQRNSGAREAPAFDLVRASVNLMMASVLIAVATSLKLPLSTTYVSFMVAMGTSLADRAWNRDTAVYRIAGVVSVILGWFFTAAVAFVAAGVLALVIHYGGLLSIALLLALTLFLIVSSQMAHRRRSAQHQSPHRSATDKGAVQPLASPLGTDPAAPSLLLAISTSLQGIIRGLETEDRKAVLRAKTTAENDRKQCAVGRADRSDQLSHVGAEEVERARARFHLIHYVENSLQAVCSVGKQSLSHLNNAHRPLPPDKMDELKALTDKLEELFTEGAESMEEKRGTAALSMEQKSSAVLQSLDTLERKHLMRTEDGRDGHKANALYLSFLVEYRAIVAPLSHPTPFS